MPFEIGQILVNIDRDRDHDYSSPSPIALFQKNKSKEGFTFETIKDLADAMVAAVPADHEAIEKIEVAAQEMTDKMQRNQGKKKNKKGNQGGAPCYINVHLRNSFLETQLKNLILNGVTYEAETK